MKETFKVTHKGVTIVVRKRTQQKNGTVYQDYIIPDYTGREGKRKRHTRRTEEEARAKAKEICELLASGKREVLHWDERLRSEVQTCMELLHPRGINLGRAATLLDSALSTGIKPEEILIACKFWLERKPNKPFTPTRVDSAIEAYWATPKKVSPKRRRTLASYLNTFKGKFGERMMHEVEAPELKRFADSKAWAPKTYNEFLNGVGLLYQAAQFESWVPKDCNPCAALPRLALPESKIGICSPAEVRATLQKVEEDLVPFLSLWFFAGARKEEIARLTWPQVRSALLTGHLYIEPDQGLKTGSRCVPLLPNLRAWLEFYLTRHPQATGLVLPRKYSEGCRLDDISKRIRRQTGLNWVENGPRHSFCTFHVKKFKDIPELIKTVGNSFKMLQKHYWNKSNTVTAEMAEEYFSIMPPALATIIPLTDAAAASTAAVAS